MEDDSKQDHEGSDTGVSESEMSRIFTIESSEAGALELAIEGETAPQDGRALYLGIDDRGELEPNRAELGLSSHASDTDDGLAAHEEVSLFSNAAAIGSGSAKPVSEMLSWCPPVRRTARQY